jgi:cytochrome P450 PksS
MTLPTPELDRFDIISPEARADIHGLYRTMRAAGPVHRFTDPFSGRPAWIVLRLPSCVEILRDTTTFIRDKSALPGAKPPGPQPRGVELLVNSMVHRDPPEHTRLRRLVNRAFSTRIVESLRERVGTIVQELLDELEPRDEFDFVQDFAAPVPIRLLCEMLGVPKSVEPELDGWGVDVISDSMPRMLGAINGLRDLINPYIDALEKKPAETLLSHLVHARTDNGERLSRVELHSMTLLLFLAGHETTVNLLSNSLLAITQDDVLRAELLAEPKLFADHLEETLRYDGPADLASVRYVSRPVEVDGYSFEVGDPVFVSLLAANRDPDVFPDPERFDLRRTNRDHIAFGAGVHSCLGSRLARMEALEALKGLFARRPGLTLAVPTSELRWKPSRMMHGLAALPVRGR